MHVTLHKDQNVFMLRNIIFTINGENHCMVRTHVQSILHEMHFVCVCTSCVPHACNAHKNAPCVFVYGHTKCIHEVHCMRMRVVLNQKIYCDGFGLCQFFLLKCFLLKSHIKYHLLFDKISVHLGSGFCVRGFVRRETLSPHFML